MFACLSRGKEREQTDNRKRTDRQQKENRQRTEREQTDNRQRTDREQTENRQTNVRTEKRSDAFGCQSSCQSRSWWRRRWRTNCTVVETGWEWEEDRQHLCVCVCVRALWSNALPLTGPTTRPSCVCVCVCVCRSGAVRTAVKQMFPLFGSRTWKWRKTRFSHKKTRSHRLHLQQLSHNCNQQTIRDNTEKM